MTDSKQVQAGYFTRIRRFMDIIYAPGLHFGFALFWFLSLQGQMVHQGGGDVWRFGSHSLLGVMTLFLVMFYLRAVDEVKDYAYDVQFNPERPLVSGAVSFRDLHILWAAAFLIIPLMNLSAGTALAVFVTLNMLYGLLLILMEKWLPWMHKSMFFNLALTYPVSIALSFYTLLLTLTTQTVVYDGVLLKLIGVYILAFLHFELVRKNGWLEWAEPGEKFYSHDIGPVPAALVGFACGVAAVVWMIVLNAPWSQSGLSAATGWLPLIALVPAQKSLTKFLMGREARFNPRKFAVLFLVLFYAVNLVHALAVNSLGWVR